MDLRLRMQKSAANVDDGMRIINRLIAALSELLSKKSISGILHTCATLGKKQKFYMKVFLCSNLHCIKHYFTGIVLTVLWF